MKGDPIKAFDDMTVAPVPADMATAAIAALLDAKMAGVFQLTGPRDVSYTEVGDYLARELGAPSRLGRPDECLFGRNAKRLDAAKYDAR